MRLQTLITSHSLALLWDSVVLFGWMGAAVVCDRSSGLVGAHRAWANVFSLVAGPVGWTLHLAPRLWQWIKSLRNTEPDSAGYERTAHGIMAAALEGGASDIHLEAKEGGYVVRFRQVGLLREHMKVHRRAGEMLVSVFKVFAELNTAEKNQL